jgi:hypothetical protein
MVLSVLNRFPFDARLRPRSRPGLQPSFVTAVDRIAIGLSAKLKKGPERKHDVTESSRQLWRDAPVSASTRASVLALSFPDWFASEMPVSLNFALSQFPVLI